ncbi:MAG TPA: hypothetical protein VNN76_02415 [Bacteroidota bacterium]|nr:hypothetical protein [Bacteroidota bacterium]
MKSHAHLVAVLLILGVVSLFAQAPTPPSPMQKQKQTIGGGLGVTRVDTSTYLLFNIAPELAFGKLGIGLDINLRYDLENQKLRTEDWDEGYDFLRIIRYVRWGLKRDPLYIRVGVLDYSRLGHGFIVYNYRNSASYDLRRIGFEFDMDFDRFGFETVYSDVAGAGLLGARGYVKPLKFTKLASVPIIGGFELGATYAADLHENANKTWGDGLGRVRLAKDGGALSIMGFDAGLPLLSLSAIQSTLYLDYAKIVDFGNGVAAGIDLNLSGLGILSLGAKYERRWTGDQFIPAYFNALYERERYTPRDTLFISKAQELRLAKASEGYYGELTIGILGRFNIVGGYYSPVGVKNQGVLHLEFDPGDVIPGILLNAGYDKRNIGKLFKLDNNSLAYVQVGYKPYPFMVVSTVYQWTFTEEKNAQGQVVGYKTQRRIEPKVGFIFNF